MDTVNLMCADGNWWLAAGGWLLAAGGWRLVAGGWQLAAGFLMTLSGKDKWSTRSWLPAAILTKFICAESNKSHFYPLIILFLRHISSSAIHC